MNDHLTPSQSPFDSASAVLFDFNGTLADDETLIADVVSTVADERLGLTLTLEEYFAHYAGFTEEEMFRRLLRGSDGPVGVSVTELVAAFTERYIDRTHDGSYISEDARTLLHELHDRGVAVGVVTAASRAMVEPALRSAGLLDLLDAVVTLDDVPVPKPDPTGYLLAVDTLPADARQRVVAVEDSRTGISAARGAGLSVVGVLGTTPETELRELSDWVVDRLEPGALSAVGAFSAAHSR